MKKSSLILGGIAALWLATRKTDTSLPALAAAAHETPLQYFQNAAAQGIAAGEAQALASTANTKTIQTIEVSTPTMTDYFGGLPSQQTSTGFSAPLGTGNFSDGLSSPQTVYTDPTPLPGGNPLHQIIVPGSDAWARQAGGTELERLSVLSSGILRGF